MRLYPPVYTLTRRAAAADQVGEWQISGGDNLVVPLHALHRLPEYWDEPDSFCPARFADLTDAQRKAYLPTERSVDDRRTPRDFAYADLVSRGFDSAYSTCTRRRLRSYRLFGATVLNETVIQGEARYFLHWPIADLFANGRSTGPFRPLLSLSNQ